MAERKNTKYRSFNLTLTQDARFVKLAERVNMTPNSLFRLLCERLQPRDVDDLAKRG